MKLRRVGALLDLDDPLDASDFDSDEYETSDYEDSEINGGLSDVAEEEEGDGHVDDDDDEGVADGRGEDEDEEAGNECNSEHDREDLDGHGSGTVTDEHDGESEVEEASTHQDCDSESQADLEEEEGEEKEEGGQEEQGELEAEEQEETIAAAFNPFSLLSEDPEQEEEQEEQPYCPKGHEEEGSGSQGDRTAGSLLAREGRGHRVAGEETPHRRRRRRPRRPRRRGAAAQAAGTHAAAYAAAPPPTGGDDSGGSDVEEPEEDEGQAPAPAAAGRVMGWEVTSGAEGAVALVQEAGPACGSSSPGNSAKPGAGRTEWRESDAGGQGSDVDESGCDNGDGDGSAECNDQHDHGGSVSECWLCYGEGLLPASGRGEGSSGPGLGAAARGHNGEGNEAEGDGEPQELLAPCRVCSGGLRYIHRRCFMRWLDSSWAIACPNCRTMYDGAVLDAHTDGASVRSMLLGSCPPSLDPRQPFPPLSLVHFCVASTVELSMSCGGFTAVELLRRIRLLVDDMAAHGSDGGLGLLREDGGTLDLPNFNITSLVLDLGPAQGPPRRLPAPRVPGPRAVGPHASEGGSSEGEWGQQETSTYDGAFVNGRFNPAYEDEYDYDEYGNDEYDYDDGEEGDEDDEGGEPAWVALRARSFTSGTPGGAVRQPVTASGLAIARRMDPAQGIRWSVDAGPFMREATGTLRGMFALPQLNPSVPGFPGMAPPHRRSEAALTRSGSAVPDRAVQRAEQQRRRADLQAQQRSQQWHTAGSRGQQGAMMGPPRGQGGRRR